MATATSARVLTFHVDASRITDVVDALDDALEQSAGAPGFVGMLGLVDDSHRPQVVMISLWDAQGLSSAPDSDGTRRRLAEIADTGVTTRTLSVLRFAEASSLGSDTPS